MSEQHKKPLCVDEELNLTANRHYDLYIDGMRMKNINKSSQRQFAHKAKLCGTAGLIAIKLMNFENQDGGFLASGSYFETDDLWKCTNKYCQGWPGVNFDDSSWPRATVIGAHGIYPRGFISGISKNAKWIWTPKHTSGSDSDVVVYCRKTRGKQNISYTRANS